MITQKTILEAYLFLREKNNTISDETLDFIYNAASEKLMAIEEEIKWRELRQKDLHNLLKRGS